MKPSQRVNAILKALSQAYPDAHCELDFANPLELLVATILSAQCTDKRVNLVTKSLFQKYKTPLDYAQAPQEVLEQEIRSTGFYRNKAKAVRAACADLVALHDGKVPDSMEALHHLHGVGRKTANVVLGNAFGKNEGVVVDTHVARLSNRLGFTQEKDPEKIERDLMGIVPAQDWTLLSHWLIWHGRRRCFARKPDCAGCEIQGLCPSAFKA
jgi:endonuclease-3